MLKTKFNSLNTKIALSFIILGLFLLMILFVLIVPKMQKEKIDYATNKIESMITLTTQQIKLAEDILVKHGEDKKEKAKSIIKYELEKI